MLGRTAQAVAVTVVVSPSPVAQLLAVGSAVSTVLDSLFVQQATLIEHETRGAIAQLGERLNGMQTPLGAGVNRSPIANDTSGMAQVIVCDGKTITT
jgi:hypothetical protein